MAFRTIVSRVVAARREDADLLWDELFSSGPGTFSIPLRPANSQGPTTHYGMNAAGVTPAQADAMAALADGTLPTVKWADGAPTETPLVWGQGNLPTQGAALAMVGGGNIYVGNMAGGGTPGEHWPGFIQGLNLEIAEDE